MCGLEVSQRSDLNRQGAIYQGSTLGLPVIILREFYYCCFHDLKYYHTNIVKTCIGVMCMNVLRNCYLTQVAK
jgi:hypothetical protein